MAAANFDEAGLEVFFGDVVVLVDVQFLEGVHELFVGIVLFHSLGHQLHELPKVDFPVTILINFLNHILELLGSGFFTAERFHDCSELGSRDCASAVLVKKGESSLEFLDLLLSELGKLLLL